MQLLNLKTPFTSFHSMKLMYVFYARSLPLKHTLYNKFSQPVKIVAVSQLITYHNISLGIQEHSCYELQQHVIPKIFSTTQNYPFKTTHQTVYPG